VSDEGQEGNSTDTGGRAEAPTEATIEDYFSEEREFPPSPDFVDEKIGPIAKPKTVVFTDELPKTRSGKIMRRLLRDVAEGRVLGDTTTLAAPAVVDEIRRLSASSPTDE
jgi:acetyl-CoA synthetase